MHFTRFTLNIVRHPLATGRRRAAVLALCALAGLIFHTPPVISAATLVAAAVLIMQLYDSFTSPGTNTAKHNEATASSSPPEPERDVPSPNQGTPEANSDRPMASPRPSLLLDEEGPPTNLQSSGPGCQDSSTSVYLVGDEPPVKVKRPQRSEDMRP